MKGKFTLRVREYTLLFQLSLSETDYGLYLDCSVYLQVCDTRLLVLPFTYNLSSAHSRTVLSSTLLSGRTRGSKIKKNTEKKRVDISHN